MFRRSVARGHFLHTLNSLRLLHFLVMSYAFPQTLLAADSVRFNESRTILDFSIFLLANTRYF